MTKKDYIAIANAIKDSKTRAYGWVGGETMEECKKNAEEIILGIDFVVQNLVKVFKIDNGNFSEDRFNSYLEDEEKRYKDFTDR